jgi:DNA-directed RNA polymerase sigma subunit (sigma70/sigma32)
VLRSSLFFRLRRERARLESLHGSSSETTQLLAEKLGLPPDEIGPMPDRLDTRDLSLDAPIYSDAGATLGDSLASHDDAEPAPRSAVRSPMNTGSAPTGPDRPPELPWVGGSA